MDRTFAMILIGWGMCCCPHCVHVRTMIWPWFMAGLNGHMLYVFRFAFPLARDMAVQ